MLKLSVFIKQLQGWFPLEDFFLQGGKLNRSEDATLIYIEHLLAKLKAELAFPVFSV